MNFQIFRIYMSRIYDFNQIIRSSEYGAAVVVAVVIVLDEFNAESEWLLEVGSWSEVGDEDIDSIFRALGCDSSALGLSTADGPLTNPRLFNKRLLKRLNSSPMSI